MTEENKAMETPMLTLTPDLTEEAAPEEQKQEAPVEPVVLDESSLTEEERKMVHDFADKIDLTNSTMILQYGSAAQKKLSDFSENALSNVRTKDLGEVGDAITNLVGELKGFDVPGYEVKNVRFKDVILEDNNGPAQNVQMQYCQNVSFENVTVQAGAQPE